MDLAIEKRGFDRPDTKLDFDIFGRVDIIKLNDGTTGMHALLQPGWSWATHEKPLVGNPETCPKDHVGYCISGELVVHMAASGDEKHIRGGDFFEIPAGHLAHVHGDETCELVLFTPRRADRQARRA